MTSNGVEVNSRSGSIRGAASLESLDSVSNSIQRARASSALKSEQRSVSRFGGEKNNGRQSGTNSASTKNTSILGKGDSKLGLLSGHDSQNEDNENEVDFTPFLSTNSTKMHGYDFLRQGPK